MSDSRKTKSLRSSKVNQSHQTLAKAFPKRDDKKYKFVPKSSTSKQATSPSNSAARGKSSSKSSPSSRKINVPAPATRKRKSTPDEELEDDEEPVKTKTIDDEDDDDELGNEGEELNDDLIRELESEFGDDDEGIAVKPGKQKKQQQQQADEFSAGSDKVFVKRPTTKATPPTKAEQKTNKKKGDDDDEDGSRVLYVGHIPYGFFEKQMRSFFNQFGRVTNLRLSRNPQSGVSRGYAFVEFEHSGVPDIVAEAMNDYLMFGKRLVCAVVPEGRLHPKTFIGAAKMLRIENPQRWAATRRVRKVKSHAAAHNARRDEAQQKDRLSRLVRKDKAKKKKLEELGISYEFPGYASTVKPTSKHVIFE